MTTYRNGNIYWINGQNRSDRNLLGLKLRDFLKTERRNWRRDVFYIDNTTFPTNGLLNSMIIANYISSMGVDTVITIDIGTAADKNTLRMAFGDRFVDMLIYNTKKIKQNIIYDTVFENQSEYSISIDTTTDTATQAFSKLICELRNRNFL